MSNEVLMPRSLTAENGAKHLLSGEFSDSYIVPCEHCNWTGTYQSKDCTQCDGMGSYSQSITTSWATIKEIYAKCVEHFDKQE